MKLVILVAILLALTFALHPKISTTLWQEFSTKPTVDFLILVKNPLDLDNLKNENGLRALDIENSDIKARVLVSELRRHAFLTQKSLQQFLISKKVAFEPLWINNIIIVRSGTKELVQELSQRDDVESIESDSAPEADFPVESSPANPETQQQTIQPNVKWIKADKVWEQGVRGKGITIAVSDTGIRYTHEVLKTNYRGYNGNSEPKHDYNWFDPLNLNGNAQPVDPNGHGTGCTGIAVGGKGYGVAPEANWIGCNALSGSSSASQRLKCIQWLAAPTDRKNKNPNPDLRPHASCNSYFCNNCRLDEAIRVLVESGVVFVKSAGNQGPGCKTITEPGFYDFVVAVAALQKESNTIASFSSRGPTKDNKMKPDISAPGHSITTAWRNSDNSYYTGSGTSFAAPGLCGSVALMWNAYPKLKRNVKATMDIFYRSAKKLNSTECGGRGSPNYTFGHGSLDVYAAYQLAKNEGW